MPFKLEVETLVSISAESFVDFNKLACIRMIAQSFCSITRKMSFSHMIQLYV